MTMSKPAIHTEWVLVTPQLAADWLTNNPSNRNLRSRIVEKYATDMRNNDWADAGDPIRRTADGKLLDGQHRLNAIVMADTEVWMLVATGVDASAQAVMDTGTARLYSDQLTIQGKRHANSLAAVLRWIVLWERGERILKGRFTPPTHSELALAWNVYPEVEDSVEFAAVASRHLRMPASVFAMAHWVFSRIDKDDADWFLSRIADGTELAADHPAYAFRERTRRDRENNRRVETFTHFALLITAWNAFRDGRRLSKLQLPAAGLNSGNYPVPR